MGAVGTIQGDQKTENYFKRKPCCMYKGVFINTLVGVGKSGGSILLGFKKGEK